MIIILLCGMIFKRLSVGIIVGIGIAVSIYAGILLKNRTNITKLRLKQFVYEIWNNGLFVFTIFYIFCFAINTGKRFYSFDEFSHWGMFLKENLRLDRLYCMSPLSFPHKDYVPALTIFETIYCKFCGRYAEADVYRATQVFMFSMLMPMFEKISDNSLEKKENIIGRKAVSGKMYLLEAVALALLIPILFNNGFRFYHMVYCDVVVGIAFYWCLFEGYRDYDNLTYQFFIVSLGLTIFVLLKMTSMALMPLVVMYLYIKVFYICDEKNINIVSLIIPFAIPFFVWYLFNTFVDRYVDNVGELQSYDGVKLSSIRQVFINPSNSEISYLKEVHDAYIDAIIHTDILIKGSYLAVVLCIVIAFISLAIMVKDEKEKRKIVIALLITAMSSLYYALLMYFLYCTAFIEYEAVNLASYQRYMASFLISVLFFLLAVYYDVNVWKDRKMITYLLALLFMDLSLMHASAFDQLLPGNIMNDDEKVSDYEACAATIMETTSENARIFIVKRGDSGDFVWHQLYYCNPRRIAGGSIGPAVYDGDIWSSDIEVEKFVDALKEYDYIYFCGLDDAFVNKYAEAFTDPSQVVDNKVCKIVGADKKIELEVE